MNCVALDMKAILPLLLCLIAHAVNAGGPQLGVAMPDLAIANRGEMIMEGDTFSWRPWSSKAAGRVQVIQYVAPLLAASKLNEPFIEALQARRLPSDKYVSVSIVNMADATFGSSPFVIGGMKDSKKARPSKVMVLDDKGHGRKAWELAQSSSAIIVLDKAGKVAFFKEGALTASEIDSTLGLIESLL